VSNPAAVRIVDYDLRWPELFERERDALFEIFDPADTAIEHVGSTAVPGLGAKPIIDILLGAPALSEIECRIAALERAGWAYLPQHEDALPERRFLAQPRTRPRSYHLHAVVRGSCFWVDHLEFRDRLRGCPDAARSYLELKRGLAARYRDDREAYTEAKGDFVRTLLRAGQAARPESAGPR